MAVTVRGKAKIDWKPNYTLTFTSTDGLTLDPGTTLHPLVATLTNTSTGAVITDRVIRLTTSPTPRVGSGQRRTTDANGQVTFQVSNVSVESVVYTASLIPEPAISEPTVTTDLTITWGGAVCSTCNTDIQSVEAERYGVDPVQGFGYSITYILRTTSGDGCGTITDVTHATGQYYVFPDGVPPDFSSYDVDEVEIIDSDPLTETEIDDLLAAMEVVRLAAVAVLEADQC